MSAFIERIIEQAKADKKTIVLPEGDDVRVQEAASKIDAALFDKTVG